MAPTHAGCAPTKPSPAGALTSLNRPPFPTGSSRTWTGPATWACPRAAIGVVCTPINPSLAGATEMNSPAAPLRLFHLDTDSAAASKSTKPLPAGAITTTGKLALLPAHSFRSQLVAEARAASEPTRPLPAGAASILLLTAPSSQWTLISAIPAVSGLTRPLPAGTATVSANCMGPTGPSPLSSLAPISTSCMATTTTTPAGFEPAAWSLAGAVSPTTVN